VSLLRHAGLRCYAETHIVDWLATHAAGVAAGVPMIRKYHNDVRARARSRDDVRLTVAAMGESLSLLRAQGHKIVPASQRLTAGWPFLAELILRLLLKSKLGEVGMSWHAQQAPDELQALADDLRQLVRASSLPVPALRKVLEMS
jgi:hypothetical protein